MAKCGSVQCDSVCACEGCHTIGNSSPVRGNACNITEIRKYWGMFVTTAGEVLMTYHVCLGKSTVDKLITVCVRHISLSETTDLLSWLTFWVGCTALSTTTWIRNKVGALSVQKNFADAHKACCMGLFLCIWCYANQGEQFLQCIVAGNEICELHSIWNKKCIHNMETTFISPGSGIQNNTINKENHGTIKDCFW